MTTQRQKTAAIHFTRLIIWLLVVVSCILDSPFTVSDILTIIGATIWLWLPNLVKLELQLVDRLTKGGK